MTDASAHPCRIEGCKRPYRAKGYCGVHYRRWRHGALPNPRYKICTHEGCRKPRHRQGVCEAHHNEAIGAAVASAPTAESSPSEITPSAGESVPAEAKPEG